MEGEEGAGWRESKGQDRGRGKARGKERKVAG